VFDGRDAKGKRPLQACVAVARASFVVLDQEIATREVFTVQAQAKLAYAANIR
jgi:hypothetical protein